MAVVIWRARHGSPFDRPVGFQPKRRGRLEDLGAPEIRRITTFHWPKQEAKGDRSFATGAYRASPAAPFEAPNGPANRGRAKKNFSIAANRSKPVNTT
jgi:hypothetical protein